jgi:excinuclease ABC subunit C
MTGIIERHSPDEWRRTASTTVKRLGDSRDLFRPKTGDIPAEPGVYKWRDGEGRVIYVGKAKNLRNRLTNYFQPLNQLHPRTQTMVLTARSLEWTVVGTELEALTLEYTWIKEFDPRFNVVFRDDKTYPYLAVSVGEDVPRVWVTRNRKAQGYTVFRPVCEGVGSASLARQAAQDLPGAHLLARRVSSGADDRAAVPACLHW